MTTNISTIEPIIIPGSDKRLESEIEVGRDEVLHFRAPSTGSRLALYGQYANLPEGHFRFELMFTISERGTGDVSVELGQHEQTPFYVRNCFKWELDAGLIQISHQFERGIQLLEVRLRVPPNCAGAIRQLAIRRRDD